MANARAALNLDSEAHHFMVAVIPFKLKPRRRRVHCLSKRFGTMCIIVALSNISLRF
jgi:hypothetical protein